MSQLTGCTTSQFAAVRKALSYTPPKNYAYAQKFNNTRYLIDAKGFFPTGLIHRLQDHLYATKTAPYTVLDARQKPTPKPVSLKGPKPYSDQTAAVKAALLYGQGIVSMPTGTGKSMVISMLAAELGLPTLVVVPTVELKTQLTETLKAAGLTNVRVENIDATALKTATKYDCLIIDECHHSAAKTYHRLNRTAWKGIYYRFCLTATPFRNQAEEQILFEAIAGRKVFELTYKEAIAKGYICPVEAYYIDLPKQPVEGYTYAEVYKELVTNNVERNNRIVDVLRSLHGANVSALCLVREIEHGRAISAGGPFPFVNGQDEDTRGFIAQFNAEKAKVLVGTTGVIGEGVDTRPCEYVIIAGIGKAKSQFMQQIGRAVRKYKNKTSAKVIIFRDPSHRFTLKHFAEQKKILLDEYGVKVVKLEV